MTTTSVRRASKWLEAQVFDLLSDLDQTVREGDQALGF